MTKNTVQWIEAGIQLASNKDSRLLCPDCQKAFLRVDDHFIEGSVSFESRIFCQSCGAENFLRLPVTTHSRGGMSRHNFG